MRRGPSASSGPSPQDSSGSSLVASGLVQMAEMALEPWCQRSLLCPSLPGLLTQGSDPTLPPRRDKQQAGHSTPQRDSLALLRALEMDLLLALLEIRLHSTRDCQKSR